jgi:glycosyltransferase involved in cell wall biosynthesis
MKPLISIVTACFNAASFIEYTIKSVKNQTIDDWEWIIVDDGSTDKSVEIINQLIEDDYRIRLIALNVNSGPAFTRNKGIELAAGKYLTFIDADDYWYPTFLEENLKRINQTQGFLCSSYEMYNESLSLKIGSLMVPKKVNYNSILKTNTISCLTAFIDIEKLGKEYMPEIRYRQDMGLWLKYLKKISYVEGIQECLAIYRIRENSHSRSKLNLLKHQWFFYREVAQLNWIKSLYFFSIWVFYGLRKYYI